MSVITLSVFFFLLIDKATWIRKQLYTEFLTGPHSFLTNISWNGIKENVTLVLNIGTLLLCIMLCSHLLDEVLFARDITKSWVGVLSKIKSLTSDKVIFL